LTKIDLRVQAYALVGDKDPPPWMPWPFYNLQDLTKDSTLSSHPLPAPYTPSGPNGEQGSKSRRWLPPKKVTGSWRTPRCSTWTLKMRRGPRV